ncbi:MraY-like glycosyltransferase [Gemmata obscuriglobus]|uniref:Tip attachment protein J domain-containing protein n=1 Tax=Gemmata obscuriglobus TaxID=114 RepID=A0A2Z3GTB2_9BACT|nr:phage tail protein [Gemmata obscuriglobus]AWM37013.1 hypothetical protein C1280_08260 [Gemmata obscuriglobus]QEG30286.1 MraY-like glycosyltransferase [Gemmata obscuriglobus]VTS09610.1 host specificity protein j : Host specificity protein J, internal deletion OS=Roseobacter sp. MED193 GN=MED193_18874 PE=4 SV=1: Phage-tail_3 [Gemmata obscuriglobus UQM 2246]
MAPVIPLVGIAAGIATSSAISAIPLGVLFGSAATGLAGLGVTSALVGAAAGFLVATSINVVGSRAFSAKPSGYGGGGSPQEARGRSIMVRSSVESHKIVYGRSRVSGPVALITTTSSGPDSTGATATGDNLFVHMVVALAGHEVEEIGTIYLNEIPVTVDGSGFVQTAPYLKDGKSYVRVKKHLGTAAQAADPDLVAEYPGWTAAHRLRGVAYIYVRMQFSADIFPQGIPNVSAVVKGKRVYDPRSGLTAWTDNAALCAHDYMAGDYGFNCAADELNDDHWGAAANVCDEAVALTTGGTRPRYTINGVVDTAAARTDNLNGLVAAMAGAVTYVQGRFRGHAGAFDAPATDLDLNDLAGPIKISARPPRKELFNRVKGTYVDPDRNWQPTDFPPVGNALYVAQDGGEEIARDVVLTLTNHPEAAQRIAKVLLEQGRQGVQVELKLKHLALSLAVWDTVRFTNGPVGWANKVFRIKSMRHEGTGPVTLSLQEESSASYEWSAGQAATYDPAPDTDLPSPFFVSPPVSLTVTEELYVTRNGDGVKAKAVLSWVASPDAFIYLYQAEYKLDTGTEWTLLPRTSATTIEVADIAPGTYNFRVKAINTLNAASVYEQTTKQISGLAAPPTEPQELYWSAIGGLAYLNWSPSPDLDVRIGGKYVFRYSPDTSGGWGSSTSIGNAVSGNASSVVLPLMPGIYLVKAEDSSGIQSAAAASVIVTQDTIYALSIVATVTEDPGFTGTKTNCAASSGKLTLTDPTLPGTYLFHAPMDLGSVQRVRLTAHLLATVINPSDLIDSRTADIDDWEDFDGTDAAAADAVAFVRTTQTDPAGSPTWTAWNRLHSGEFVARGFQFKLELTSYDPAYTIEISELNVKAAQ